MSWAAEVIAEPNGKWTGNALRFETRKEATEYVHDLYSRWSLVQRMRVVESPDPVNYAWIEDKLVNLEGRRTALEASPARVEHREAVR